MTPSQILHGTRVTLQRWSEDFPRGWSPLLPRSSNAHRLDRAGSRLPLNAIVFLAVAPPRWGHSSATERIACKLCHE
jgi:hypothetical protein